VAPHPTPLASGSVTWYTVLFFSILECKEVTMKRREKEKENWRILTNKEIYARVEKPTVIETIRLNRLR
jgi:hypothetical protein